jgi:hypothetical protein
MFRDKEESQHESFRVLCIWCAAKIRDDDREDASGLCLKCFYQLINEHLRNQKVSGYGDFVSER